MFRIAGPGQNPLSNDQPSLAVNYLIDTSGAAPSPFFGQLSEADTLGQVVEFARRTYPAGWALANGQLLPISGNENLFDLIGTTYGGDGVTDFALPDLDGRTVIGADVPDVSPLARAAFTVSDGDDVGDTWAADDIFLASRRIAACRSGAFDMGPFDNGLSRNGYAFMSRKIAKPSFNRRITTKSGG